MTGFQFGLEGTDMLSAESTKHFSRSPFSTSIFVLFSERMSLYKRALIWRKDSNDGVWPGLSIQKANPFLPRSFHSMTYPSLVMTQGIRKESNATFFFYHWWYGISLGSNSVMTKNPTVRTDALSKLTWDKETTLGSFVSFSVLQEILLYLPFYFQWLTTWKFLIFKHW